jgi:hypothetical protein
LAVVKRVLPVAIVLLVPTVAGVAGAVEETATTLDSPNARRAGVVVGLNLGYGLAGSSGYPNSATKIDVPAFYSSSDLMSGGGGSLFVMGALADYVSFGLWFGSATYQSADWRSTGFGVGFRVEAFPLYVLVPSLADLGVYTQLGVGSTSLTTKVAGNYPSADGAQSFLGAGMFYELLKPQLLGGHLAAGPSAEYDVITSRATERHGALAGVRVVFYGGK